MIDAVLKFASVAAAKTALANHTPLDDQGVRQWAQDHVLPITVWRTSQDNPDGTHNPLAGFYILISLTNDQARDYASLRDSPAIQFVINRDNNNVLKSVVGAAVLNDVRFEPVFAGSDYPWGAFL